MQYETLIEPAALLENIGSAQRTQAQRAHWTIVDCRFDLARPAAGEEAYARGHIPGAVYAHLDRDLSAAVGPTTGRHPLPNIEVLTRKLGLWGIDANTQVVAYDDANGAFAARLWWLLRWLGHHKVAVLNGGFKAWEAAGYPLEHQSVAPTPKNFHARVQSGAWLTTEQVEKGIQQGTLQLIDARTDDRFAGRNETLDTVAGHIPTARNHPFPSNLDASQRFLTPEQLREHWAKTLRDTPPEQIACMCGSGVTACHNLLALQVAGIEGAKLYAGSWSEWIRNPQRPVATGPENNTP